MTRLPAVSHNAYSYSRVCNVAVASSQATSKANSSRIVGVALNQEGIAVRSGHHCAQPILRRMGVESTVRPSLAFYNTCEDIDALVAALLRLQAGRGHRKL